jgi:hypothetical protein
MVAARALDVSANSVVPIRPHPRYRGHYPCASVHLVSSLLACAAALKFAGWRLKPRLDGPVAPRIPPARAESQRPGSTGGRGWEPAKAGFVSALWADPRRGFNRQPALRELRELGHPSSSRSTAALLCAVSCAAKTRVTGPRWAWSRRSARAARPGSRASSASKRLRNSSNLAGS